MPDDDAEDAADEVEAPVVQTLLRTLLGEEIPCIRWLAIIICLTFRAT